MKAKTTSKRIFALLLCAALLMSAMTMPAYAGGDTMTALDGAVRIDIVDEKMPDGLFGTAEMTICATNISQNTIYDFNLSAVSDDVTFLYITGGGSSEFHPGEAHTVVFRMQTSFSADGLNLFARLLLLIRALFTDSYYAPVKNEDATLFTSYYQFGDQPATVQFQVTGNVTG